jgi:ankyrin repeat protein
MLSCECRAVLQTDGGTPLHSASYSGHVECVRALLEGGAAINQAAVGCAGSMARNCGGCGCWASWKAACMHAFAAGWMRGQGTRWRVWARAKVRPGMTA